MLKKPEFTFTSPLVFVHAAAKDGIGEGIIKLALQNDIPYMNFSALRKMKFDYVDNDFSEEKKGNLYFEVYLYTREDPGCIPFTDYRESYAVPIRYYAPFDELIPKKHRESFPFLSDMFTIILCTKDIYERNQKRYVQMPRLVSSAGTEIKKPLHAPFFLDNQFYLNAAYHNKNQNKTALTTFLNYVNTGKPNDDFTKQIDHAVNQVKKEKRWDLLMFYKAMVEERESAILETMEEE